MIANNDYLLEACLDFWFIKTSLITQNITLKR